MMGSHLPPGKPGQLVTLLIYVFHVYCWYSDNVTIYFFIGILDNLFTTSGIYKFSINVYLMNEWRANNDYSKLVSSSA